MSLRHFDQLDAAALDTLFLRPPEPFDTADPVPVVAMGLGATLYSPATRPRLADDLLRARAAGTTSSVLCLEDAIADGDVEAAQHRVVSSLRSVAGRAGDVPLTFVRVRTPQQVHDVVAALGAEAAALTGFVLPKFGADSGPAYLEQVVAASDRLGRRVLAMPVVESPEVMVRTTRDEALAGIHAVLRKYDEHVLAVRAGATDLGSVYGLRRPRDLTVWDIRMVADALGGIVNALGRPDDGWTVTGPVWEYFSTPERLFKPLLRESPFDAHQARALRAELVARDLDGLIREVVLDRANGLVGKTVIHPSHVAPVHALSVVTHEEFVDADRVLRTVATGGGAAPSDYGNKMNEASPHRRWAERTLLRARVFGVTRPEVSLVDLLAATVGDA